MVPSSTAEMQGRQVLCMPKHGLSPALSVASFLYLALQPAVSLAESS